MNSEQCSATSEYQGTQAGAIVEPEQAEPEAGGVQFGGFVNQKRLTNHLCAGDQSGAIIEPEQVPPTPEYTGTQAGAIVDPEIAETRIYRYSIMKRRTKNEPRLVSLAVTVGGPLNTHLG